MIALARWVRWSTDAAPRRRHIAVPMHDAAPTPPHSARGFACPHCAGSIERIARRWYDRLLSLWMPVRRYRCRSAQCRWEGALQRRRDCRSRPGAAAGFRLPR